MKYDHMVKKNGIYYAAGEEVPESVPAVENIPLPEHVEARKKEEPEEEKTYTKTGINKMSTEDLKKLAKQKKIKNSANMTGVELKKCLIDLFGL